MTADRDYEHDGPGERTLAAVAFVALTVGATVLVATLLAAWVATPALAQADPISEHARAAAEAAGLPAWAQALIPILAGALVAALRAWLTQRSINAAVIAGVDKGAEALRARGQAALVPVVQESIRSAAIEAGVQGALKRAVAGVRATAKLTEEARRLKSLADEIRNGQPPAAPGPARGAP